MPVRRSGLGRTLASAYKEGTYWSVSPTSSGCRKPPGDGALLEVLLDAIAAILFCRGNGSNSTRQPADAALPWVLGDIWALGVYPGLAGQLLSYFRLILGLP